MSNQKYTPFLYGSTAHFPAKKRDKSDIIIIDIGQHPIIFSRAVGTLQPEDKISENDIYLTECRRVCEESCPIREPSLYSVNCKRLSLIRAIANTEDRSELDVNTWLKILRSGLCKPKLY